MNNTLSVSMNANGIPLGEYHKHWGTIYDSHIAFMTVFVIDVNIVLFL